MTPDEQRCQRVLKCQELLDEFREWGDSLRGERGCLKDHLMSDITHDAEDVAFKPTMKLTVAATPTNAEAAAAIEEAESLLPDG